MSLSVAFISFAKKVAATVDFCQFFSRLLRILFLLIRSKGPFRVSYDWNIESHPPKMVKLFNFGRIIPKFVAQTDSLDSLL